MGSDRPRVLVAARVPCDPAEAFARFTTEIGQWWQPNGLFQFSEGRNGTLAFEPGEGGRLIETYDDDSSFVVGVINTWAPPRLLVLSWRYASFPANLSTELHVTFEPTEPGQTRVTIEHYGWESIPADHATRHNFPLATFQLRFAEWWRSLLGTAFLHQTLADSNGQNPMNTAIIEGTEVIETPDGDFFTGERETGEVP